MKKSKLSTPDWIREGYDSREEWEKDNGIKGGKDSKKVFRIKKCPKCKSDEVRVLIGEEEAKNMKKWGCQKCGWKGATPLDEELSEEEFMRYMDDKNIEPPDEESLGQDFKKEIEGGEEEDF